MAGSWGDIATSQRALDVILGDRMKIRLLLFASVLLFAAGAVALAGQVSRHAIGPTSDALATNHQPGGFNEVITFYADVASIVQQKCQRCHRPNASGPFLSLIHI